MKKLSRGRRIALAIGAGGMAAGVLSASAASLGGLTVQNLGSNNTVIQACTTTGIMLTSWGNPQYSIASNEGFFAFNQITLSSIGTCTGRAFRLVIGNNSGSSIASTGGVLASAASTVLTVNPAFDAEDATQVTLVIY